MRHTIFRRHTDAPRRILNAATTRRSRQKRAAWSACAMLSLMVILFVLTGLQQSYAVVPYRSADDYGPSLQARSHLPACRRAAIEAMTSAGPGKIESESFVRRNDMEYFRFVMRHGTREVLIICDSHAGIIRRQIDIWGDL